MRGELLSVIIDSVLVMKHNNNLKRKILFLCIKPKMKYLRGLFHCLIVVFVGCTQKNINKNTSMSDLFNIMCSTCFIKQKLQSFLELNTLTQQIAIGQLIIKSF